MSEHTFQINISTIINSQPDEWNFELMKTIDYAFKSSDNHSRLLGNLLIMEQYVNTLRQGLVASDKTLSAGLECACNILWNYLNDCISPTAFE